MVYKVIVIEDERMLRRYISDYINESMEGFYVVSSFSDGKPALDYIRDNKVDLVVTDVKLLEVSGLEVAKYISENDLHIKVVMLSGYRDFSYVQQAMNYNVTAYLTKPTNPEELQSILLKIKGQLDKKNADNAYRVSVEESTKKYAESAYEKLDEKLIMDRALEYMAANLDKNLSIRGISDYVYLSEGYFSRLFKKYFNTGVNNYFQSMRMNKAIELVLSGNYSVSEISKMVGFKNSNYFIRVFREYTGYTPKKYPRHAGNENG